MFEKQSEATHECSVFVMMHIVLQVTSYEKINQFNRVGETAKIVMDLSESLQAAGSFTLI